MLSKSSRWNFAKICYMYKQDPRCKHEYLDSVQSWLRITDVDESNFCEFNVFAIKSNQRVWFHVIFSFFPLYTCATLIFFFCVKISWNQRFYENFIKSWFDEIFLYS